MAGAGEPAAVKAKGKAEPVAVNAGKVKALEEVKGVEKGVAGAAGAGADWGAPNGKAG